MGKQITSASRTDTMLHRIVRLNAGDNDARPPRGRVRMSIQYSTQIGIPFSLYTLEMAKDDASDCMKDLQLEKGETLRPEKFFALKLEVVVLCLVGDFERNRIKLIRSRLKDTDFVCEEKHSEWVIGDDGIVRSKGQAVTPTPTPVPEPEGNEVGDAVDAGRAKQLIATNNRKPKAGSGKTAKGELKPTPAQQLAHSSVVGPAKRGRQGAGAGKKAKVEVGVAAGNGVRQKKGKETKKKALEITTSAAVIDSSSDPLKGTQYDDTDVDIMREAGIPFDDVLSNSMSMTRVASTDQMIMDAATPVTKTNGRSATLKRKREMDEVAVKAPKGNKMQKNVKKGEEVAVDVDVDDMLDAALSEVEVEPVPALKKARRRAKPPMKAWQTMKASNALAKVAKAQGMHRMKKRQMIIDVRRAQFKDPLPRNPALGLDRINASGFSKRSHKLFQLAQFAVWRGDMEVARYWIGEHDESIPHIRHSPAVHLTEEELMMPYLAPDGYVAPDFPAYEFYPYPFDAACLPSNRVV